MKFLYPNGKAKALTFSYDDGQNFDIRLAKLFRDNKMKATFHLNSGVLSDNDTDLFVNKNRLAEIYATHEIAVHGEFHKMPSIMSATELAIEIGNDRRALEELTGDLVQGMSYAYGAYSDLVKNIAASQGIKYSRTVNSTHGYDIPSDFLEWNPTIHHSDDLLARGDEFLALPDWKELPLMYVWGHSFEFGYSNDWSGIEAFVEKMKDKEDIWYATNGEICRYIQALQRQEYSCDGKWIYNPTVETVWARTSRGKIISVAPGTKEATD